MLDKCHKYSVVRYVKEQPHKYRMNKQAGYSSDVELRRTGSMYKEWKNNVYVYFDVAKQISVLFCEDNKSFPVVHL